MSAIVSLALFTDVELKEDVELTMPVSLIFIGLSKPMTIDAAERARRESSIAGEPLAPELSGPLGAVVSARPDLAEAALLTLPSLPRLLPFCGWPRCCSSRSAPALTMLAPLAST
mgnify:CR=1 FL=1